MKSQTFAKIFAKSTLASIFLFVNYPTRAAEFCVTCNGPDAQYRCAVSSEGVLTAPPGAQLACIRQLARQGGHKSCTVRRDAPANCDGQLIVLSPNPDQQIPADHPINKQAETVNETNGPTEAEKPYGPAVPVTKEPKPTTPPKTVEELAKQTIEQTPENLKSAGRVVVDTAKQTGDQIKNAGDFVGSTAKTTWNCLTSFFSNCSNKSEPAADPELKDGPQAPSTATVEPSTERSVEN